MAKNGALAAGYAWPAILAGLAVGSFFLAYFYYRQIILCGPTTQVYCLDHAAYFSSEGLAYTLLAFLGLRAVNRARAGREMWTMRTYWPSVLGAAALVSLAGYLFVLFEGRGCEVAPYYVLYGCWDPGVTALRLTLGFILTGVFTFGMAEWVRSRDPDEGRDDSRDEPSPETPEDDEGEVIG